MIVDRKQLINELAEKTGLYKYQVKFVLEDLETIVKNHLIAGDVIKIKSLLKAEVKEYKEHTTSGINTSKTITIPALKRIKITISRALNNEINSRMKNK